MRSQIPEILERLAALRERLPVDRAGPLPPDSTWLVPAERDDRLCWALAQAGAIMIELDQDARIVFVSPNVEQITGYPPDEFRGIYVGDRVHPDDLERLVDVSRAMGDGASPDRPRVRARHKRGGWVHLEAVSASRFRCADGRIHSVSILCDVTERQEAWAALRESEGRYRVITEASRDAIAEVNEKALYTYSSGLEEVLGYSVEEFAAMPPFALVHPEDRERVAGLLRKSFDTGETVELEPFRMQHKSGHYTWYECTGVTYRCGSGERRFVTVGRDVTERLRQAEERRALEIRMLQAQRLESLGVLAGGIAHDFNNLLTPILGESRLLLMDLPESSPLRERIERIQRAAQRAAELTQQMLANAGAETPRAELVDLSELVDEMARLVDGGGSEQLELRYEMESRLPAVRGDAAQIGQVVTNLVTNALEALEDGRGRVAVRTGEVELVETDSPSKTPGLAEPLPPGRYVFLEVEDSGTGMDPETLSRIFDPFFTTKFTGRGLGLAAVMGIVRGHEGGIEIDTTPGQGTRFRVLFPPGRSETPAP